MSDDNNRITGSGTERARSATGTRVRNKTVMLNSDLTGSVRARLGGEFQPATDSGRIGGLEDRVVTADSNWEVPTVSSEMLIKAAEGAPEEEGEVNEEATERWAEPVEEDASIVETGEQEQQWEATQPDPEVSVPEDPQQSPEQQQQRYGHDQRRGACPWPREHGCRTEKRGKTCRTRDAQPAVGPSLRCTLIRHATHALRPATPTPAGVAAHGAPRRTVLTEGPSGLKAPSWRVRAETREVGDRQRWRPM